MKKRNGNIELLRAVFALGIVFLHTNLSYFHCRGGYLGVEFFFIVTGIFMGQRLHGSAGNMTWKEAVNDSSNEVKSRIKAIFPLLVVSTLIGLGIRFLTGMEKAESLTYVLGDLFLVQSAGFYVLSATGTVWYLCALFMALWLIGPVARKQYQIYTEYAAPLLVPVSMGVLTQRYGSLDCPNEMLFGWINTGVVRAVSMISLGMLVYEISVRLQQTTLTDFARRLCTLGEIFLYFTVFLHIVLYKTTNPFFGRVDGIIALCLGLALAITRSGQSYLDGKFDHPVVFFLGKFSSVLFLNHYYWVKQMPVICRRFSLGIDKDTAKLCGIAAAFITSYLVYILMKNKDRALIKLRECLVSEE